MVSVIVPAYNVSSWLSKCLSSILQQTYQDIELIVVDDGSTDDSGQIAEQYARDDARVRVIHKENAGLPQARRTGVENARGEYIGFVDGDDFVEPDMYETLVELARRTGADIACASLYWDDEDEGRAKEVQSLQFDAPAETVFTAKEAIVGVHKRNNVRQNVWNKIYKRELFDSIDFPHGNPVGEDYGILMQVLMNCSTVAQVNKPLYHYVLHVGSMCHVGYSPERIDSLRLYGRMRETLLKRFPELERTIIPYQLYEELGVIISMGRAYTDANIAKHLQRDIRRNLPALLTSAMPFKVKLSGMAASVCWHTMVLYGRLHRSSYAHG